VAPRVGLDGADGFLHEVVGPLTDRDNAKAAAKLARAEGIRYCPLEGTP
jgi:hypothetical protein